VARFTPAIAALRLRLFGCAAKFSPRHPSLRSLTNLGGALLKKIRHCVDDLGMGLPIHLPAVSSVVWFAKPP
jgi:hypothetical protein